MLFFALCNSMEVFTQAFQRNQNCFDMVQTFLGWTNKFLDMGETAKFISEKLSLVWSKLFELNQNMYIVWVKIYFGSIKGQVKSYGKKDQHISLQLVKKLVKFQIFYKFLQLFCVFAYVNLATKGFNEVNDFLMHIFLLYVILRKYSCKFLRPYYNGSKNLLDIGKKSKIPALSFLKFKLFWKDSNCFGMAKTVQIQIQKIPF